MDETISSFICKELFDAGVHHIFFVPGAQVFPFLTTLVGSELTAIHAINELGAAYMADGYARVSGNMGVCTAIGGPGANNMLTAAMIARVDEVGVLFITGDVPSRQKTYHSFQDTGYHGSRDAILFESSIDHSVVINNEGDLLPVLKVVFSRMKSKKPAHIVIPYDVQDKLVKNTFTIPFSTEEDDENDAEEIESIARVLVSSVLSAQKPVLLVGHRLIRKQERELLIHFAERTGTHVATTYRAKGVFPENHHLSLRNYGVAGNKLANDFIHSDDCDLVVMLGVKLSQRDTFHFNSSLFREARKTLIVDKRDAYSELKVLGGERYVISSSFNQILKKAILMLPEITKGNNRPEITNGFTDNVNSKSLSAVQIRDGCIGLDFTVKFIRKNMPQDTMFFCDSGFHRLIGGTAWEVNQLNTFFTTDLQAPMGWAICAAIGGKLARPGSPAVVLTGDGCMQMHGMELATAARYAVHVIFIVSNNASYGAIERRLPHLGKINYINWVDFGRSIGVDGMEVNNAESLADALSLANDTKGPFIIDLQTDKFEPLPPETCIPDGLWLVL